MKKKLLLLILLLVFIPIKAYALTGSTSLDCDKTEATAGENISCTLKGNIQGESGETEYISSYSGNITLGTGLTLVSSTRSSIWGFGDPNTAVLEYSGVEADVTGDFDIATIVVKVDDNVTGSLSTSIGVGTQMFYGRIDYNGKAVNNATHNVTVKSTNNNLSGLTLSEGTLSPEFDKTKISYTATVNSDRVTVGATPEDNTAQITGTGEKELTYGTNTVRVVVKAQSGAEKTYTITIERPDTRSNVSDLLGFGFFDYEVNFDKTKTSYSIKVNDTINKLAVCKDQPTDNSILCIDYESVVVQEKANITSVLYNEESIDSLNVASSYVVIGDVNKGDNILSITVTAENGASKTYRFTITKGSQSSPPKTDTTPTNTTGGKGTITNPKTGSAFIYAIILILAVSAGLFGYYYKKNLKEEQANAKK